MAVLCLFKLLHMQDVFDLTWGSLRLRQDSAWRIIRIGIPSAGAPPCHTHLKSRYKPDVQADV